MEKKPERSGAEEAAKHSIGGGYIILATKNNGALSFLFPAAVSENNSGCCVSLPADYFLYDYYFSFTRAIFLSFGVFIFGPLKIRKIKATPLKHRRQLFLPKEKNR